MIRLWMEASKRIPACKPLLEEKGRNQYLNNGAPTFRHLRGAAKEYSGMGGVLYFDCDQPLRSYIARYAAGPELAGGEGPA